MEQPRMAQGTGEKEKNQTGPWSESICDPERSASVQSVPPGPGWVAGREAIMIYSPMGKIVLFPEE